MFKKSLFLFLIISLLLSLKTHALDQHMHDKLMTYYIKNDGDQFSELLDEVIVQSKNQADLYNDLQTLSNKFNDLNAFYTKKQHKRLMRARKGLTNALFYSLAAALSLTLSGHYYSLESDIHLQKIYAGVGGTVASIFAWFARANLTSSIVDYNFFAKLVRKNKKFWSAVEKLKQATAMQMEVQIPVAEGVRLSVD